MITLHQIRTIGFFLATYESDLQYIDNFKRLKNDETVKDLFCQKGDHTFYSFLSEFRVTRNFKKSKCKEILSITLKWLKKNKPTDVDGLALELKQAGLTHNKIMTSLASKILFLNQPQKIVPLDNRVKKSVGQDSNFYSDYYSEIRRYKYKHKKEIKLCLTKIDPFAKKIERKFKNLNNISAIRKNRLFDKLLWTLNGQSE